VVADNDRLLPARGHNHGHRVSPVPSEGYRPFRAPADPDGDAGDERRRTFGPQHRLTLEQARLAQQRLTLAIRRRRQEGRPCKGPWLAAILAGIVSAVKHGRVGNSAWGWSMHGKRGGQSMARHGLYKLREISPAGVRASLIARDRRKAEQERARHAKEEARRLAAMPPLGRELEVRWQRRREQEQRRPPGFLAQ
jgi:hypothetical protein